MQSQEEALGVAAGCGPPPKKSRKWESDVVVEVKVLVLHMVHLVHFP